MNEEEIIQTLLDSIANAGSARKFAAKTGFSNTYISNVINGKDKPSPRLLNALGYEKRVEIIKTEA